MKITHQLRRRDILAAGGGLALAACGSTGDKVDVVRPGTDPVSVAYAKRQDELYAARGLAAKTRDIRIKGATLPRQGLRIHMKETGSGPPILLIHGGNGTGAHWLPLMTRLPGYRLIAPDGPGCGLSDPYLYDGVDMRAHGSAFVKGVMDGMDLKRATVVGNSMGGYFAMCFAIDYPERVDHLILAGGPAGATETPFMSTPDIEARVRESRQPGRPGFAGLMVNTQRMPEDLLGLLDMSRELPGTEEALRSQWRATTTQKLTFALRPEMPKITSPTLLLWGDQDRVDPPGGGASRSIMSAIPGCKASAVLDAGHLVWIDKPDECARQIIQFIG